MPDLARGAVFWAAPDPTVGVEQAGRRPFVTVASAGYLEQVTNLVIAVPVTSTRRGWPNHVPLMGATGLDVECFAMTEQVRTLARARIVKTAGTVDHQTMGSIDSWLRDFLQLERVD
ncbi:type II toxin-antitoxin system PemK/MazF family toxin [Ruania alba]|uniref:mRNA interferase MazF n=1 Tax=Ruania alba TaxID=648782 RepID=A0A1H5KMJ2_9MICO|nr:type II toxin-antitoxin system PemK/MazF family toxin [Ruania alba]SEE65198.1 mRNA interferase MazF [Ruania alba]